MPQDAYPNVTKIGCIGCTGHERLSEIIIAQIPDSSSYFVEDDVGQLTEVVMDSFDIPRFEASDRKTLIESTANGRS